jgi:signal transduction histidine kinase
MQMRGRFLRPDRRPDALRQERLIAAGRAFLASVVLIAILLDPTEPARLAGLVQAMLLGYVIYAFGVLLIARRRLVLGWSALTLHVVDILWATAITSVTAGPGSPLFVFFTFAMLAAASRWGLAETAGTAIAAVVITLGENWLIPHMPVLSTAPVIGLTRMIVRSASQLTTGLLLGFLAEQEKRSRGEILAIASVMKRPSVTLGMGGTMRSVGEEMLRLFAARELIFVAREPGRSEVALWSVRAEPGAGPIARLNRLSAEDAGTYFFDAPRAWRADGSGLRVAALADHAAGARPTGDRVPAAFLSAHPCASVLAVQLKLIDAGESRVFVLDSAMAPDARTLPFLLTLIEHVAPAMHGVYLLRRLRAKAGAAERARVARELHDGAIQSLIALEMEIEALRRRAAVSASEFVGDLAYMQDLVRRQVLDLRELMNHLRPLDFEATDQLPDLLAAMVEKFRRDTGISARFVSSAERLTISQRSAVEVARIVQESLVNVRRHSRARNVLVSLATENGRCRLSVDDDGCGFEFSGRLSDHEMDQQRQGPVIIRERARAMGATLAIESRPGEGARLELMLPEGARA